MSIYEKQLLFDDLPIQYKLTVAQSILFTYPFSTDHDFLLAGGMPLDFASWLNIDGFTPSAGDIDFVVNLESDKDSKYYIQMIQSMDNKLFECYDIKCLTRIGDYTGSVPPTSYFTFDNTTCLAIIQKSKFNTLPLFIQKLVKIISECNDMDHIDIIPFIDEHNKPTDDIIKDAIRRDFTINTFYTKISFNVDTEMVTISVIDPLDKIDDLLSLILRTPIEPEITFILDPRRLSRIPKMVEKMFRLFGKCDIAQNLIDFINDSDTLKKSIKMLLHKYPRREPLHLDILRIMQSIHFEKIIKLVLVYPEMFKLFCEINHIDITCVPINKIIKIRGELLNLGIEHYECNVLALVITVYKIVNNLENTFTISNFEHGTHALSQYTQLWLPILKKEIYVTINVLNFIGIYEVGSNNWYQLISEFLLFNHNSVTLGLNKSIGTAYGTIVKILNIIRCFNYNNIVLPEHYGICEEIHSKMKNDIIALNNCKNKQHMVNTIKNEATLLIKAILIQ